MSGLKQDFDLQSAMERLRDAAPRGPSAGTERRLIKEFRRWRTRRWVYWSALAACMAILVTALLVGSISRAKHAGYSVAVDPSITAGFIALPYAQSGVPMEEVMIVRTKLGPARLSSLGVPVTATLGRQDIDADLLVGQDGVPRAIRVVR